MVKSWLQDFFDAEEGNRESFDYNKPTSSTANPLYGRDGEAQTSSRICTLPENVLDSHIADCGLWKPLCDPCVSSLSWDC